LRSSRGNNSNFGAVGSLTFYPRTNTIKTGFEVTRFPLTESFTFAITDLNALLEKEPDLTDEAQEFTLAPSFSSLTITAPATRLRFISRTTLTPSKFDAGSRRSIRQLPFLGREEFPESEAGRRISNQQNKDRVRSSFKPVHGNAGTGKSLAFVISKLSYFSPAEEAGAPTFAPVRPSRETQVDFGFQTAARPLSAVRRDYYFRRLNNQPEITNFFETGIIFPATLNVIVPRGLRHASTWRAFLGFWIPQLHKLPYYGFAPITGGLFLGEAVDSLSRSGEKIKIEEDQRNTGVFELRYDHLPSHFFVAFSGRHDSGYSVEFDPDVTREEFEGEFPRRS